MLFEKILLYYWVYFNVLIRKFLNIIIDQITIVLRDISQKKFAEKLNPLNTLSAKNKPHQSSITDTQGSFICQKIYLHRMKQLMQLKHVLKNNI